MTMDINEMLSKLSVKQKIRMLSGRDFWTTKDWPELNIGSFEVADGPYGVRKQVGLCDHMGWNKSEPATAYVSGPGLAASFDVELASETGKHLAAEAREKGVDILLGPAVNIVRTPLCGRNFEYYSEDPLLAGELAASYINGVQSQGVGTCIKHFAANNQEVDREYIDAIIDERALREIYLKVFEIAIEKASPWAVMTALNKVNGEYCSENNALIKDYLRGELGYNGLVMSDWSGINNRQKALSAGLDLEMPYSFGVSEDRLYKAYEEGSLCIDDINKACFNILATLEKVFEGRMVTPEYIDSNHDSFVRLMAEKCAVLLKNEDKILPLNEDENILVCGNFAINPRFKMEGSALVNPTGFDIPLDEIKNLAKGNVKFLSCYDSESKLIEEDLEQAVEYAKTVDKVIVFAGLPSGIEAEGKDRKNIFIPDVHEKIIKEISKANKNTVVVLLNGSPVDTSWDSNVKGLLEMFLAGQRLGSAVARLLYGKACPGGKLPVTFPCALENSPAYLNYPGYSGKVEYKESIFVGYRYYSSKKIEVKYPFGYGLSYSTFKFSNFDCLFDGKHLKLELSVENRGSVEASEVVQIYIVPPKSRVPRPTRELKAFERIYLGVNERKSLSFTLDEKAFKYFDPTIKAWYAPSGKYSVVVGNSSENTIVSFDVDYVSDKPRYDEITGWSSIGKLRVTDAGREAISELQTLLRNSDNDRALSFPLVCKDEKDMEKVDSIPLRMITVLTDNVINNDIMDRLIDRVNRKNQELAK